MKKVSQLGLSISNFVDDGRGVNYGENVNKNQAVGF